MALLFSRGALPSNVQKHVLTLIDKYPYVVLLRERLSYEWAKKNLIVHDIGEHDDGYGGTRYRSSHRYALCESIHGIFYFFLDKRDYDTVCALKTNVIDPSPFQTILQKG